MSFGDLGDTDITLSSPSPAPSSASRQDSRRLSSRISGIDGQVTELQRLLKPLALNNASLRQSTHVLQNESRPSAAALKRMRALRDQNRNIASAAATLVSRLDASSPNTATIRSSFKPLLDDFAALYTLSVRAERNAVTRLNDLSPSASTPVIPHVRSRSHPHLPSILNYKDASSPEKLSDASGMPKHARSVSIELHGALLDEEERRTSAAREAFSSNDHASESASLIQSSPASSTQSVYQSVDLRDEFVSERRVAIDDINSTMHDVSSIFKDLAVMVDDQRAQVVTADLAVADSVTRVDAAQRELMKTYQRRNRRKSFFFCTLFSVASIISIFLIIMLG